MLVELPLDDADLRFDPNWLPAREADSLFSALRTQVDWEIHRIRLFGRLVDSPRLSSWIGDDSAAYTYSGSHFQPRPWPPALLAICSRVGDAAGVQFNSVLANLYRDGRDAMGWHSDDERQLGAQPVIASLSLGATRRFALKHRRGIGRLQLELGTGSLLVMGGDTQGNYRHALPRTARPVGERINLTFRRIVVPRAGSTPG